MPPIDYAAFMHELEAYRRSDPLLYLNAVAMARDVRDPELRHFRSEVLHGLATKLHRAMQACDFRNELVLRADGVFVDVSGVLMESSRTAIYFKSSGEPYRSPAESIGAALSRRGIAVTTAVDVGANFGEITLWLAKTYPAARVIAIEPSSDNLEIFEVNRSAQTFATERVEAMKCAVTDRRGSACISRGVGTMNRLVETESPESETVPSDTLDGIFERCGIAAADFVKIDIEGGEPKLAAAMAALGKRVRSYFIEFSQFAPLDDYLALASQLLSTGYACYDEDAATPLRNTAAIADQAKHAFAEGPIAVTNLWFIREHS